MQQSCAITNASFMFTIIIYLLSDIKYSGEMDKGHDKSQDHKERVEDILYCRQIKQFLESFKTKRCNIAVEHNEQICIHHHSKEDKRRNPYLTHTFLYYPNKLCNCEKEKCQNFHNKFEKNYHPLVYKSQKCNNYYECMYHLQCYGVHAIDDKHFQQGEYFRFDIELFKTKQCMRKDQHERKVCLYYHNDKDKRRPKFDSYNHIPCSKSNCNCQKSHNKIQQLYHPSRYKSKFCQTFGKDSFMCQYRDFCSFAHTKQQITIELIDPNNEEPNYTVNWYKTVWCPYTHDHDRSICVYAHNIQDFRRRPKDYKYLPQKCQAWNFSNKIQSIQQAGCKSGMKCNKCHGWMEQRFHPQIYLKKNKHYINKQEALEKKLHHQRDHSKNIKQKNIQTIANKEIQSKIESNKTSKFSVGAPFFKSQRDISETSKATKAKSGNIGSDKSCNQSEQRAKIISQNNKKSNKITNSVYLQDDIWTFSHQSEILQQKSQKEQTRSKSQGNTEDHEQSYSRSIKDVFLGDSSLLDKLNKNRIHQIIFINIDDRKINDMNFLNKGQKEKLLCKLKEYSLKKAIRFVEYSRKLTLFFVKNNADDILQKLREKKIKQQKILKLNTLQSTKNFQFLSEEERESLPKLMKIYNNDIQFGSLIKDVQEYVVQPNYQHDFNNDN